MSDLTLEIFKKKQFEWNRAITDNCWFSALVTSYQNLENIVKLVAPKKDSTSFLCAIKVFPLIGMGENEVLGFTKDSTALDFIKHVEDLQLKKHLPEEAVCLAKKAFGMKTKG